MVSASNTPTEPTADQRAFAAMLWQQFNALLAEGFSEHQALQLLGAMMAASWGQE